MMKIKYTHILIFIFTALLVSCKKFFEYKPSTTSINPTTVNDLMEVLNADSNAISNFTLADVVSDDDSINNNVISNNASHYTRAYTWDQIIWMGNEEDIMYNGAYNRILQMNVILERIDNAPLDNKTEQDRSVTKAQALINRAWQYLQLDNIYGPAYNSATANTDLSVPLIVVPNAAQYPSRSTVSAIYDLILNDLHTATGYRDLPTYGIDIMHPGKAAGYALLSRAYLYRQQYDSASIYADSVLALNNSLQDYNNGYKQTTQLQDLVDNPEILMAKIGMNIDYYETVTSSFIATADLQNKFGYSDIRGVKAFGYSSEYYTVGSSPQTLIFDYSIATPEVILTKAECLARLGNKTEALSLLEKLRENRIYTWAYEPLITDENTDIVSLVLEERRKELFYHGGLRLFDLKRLNLEPAYQKTLVRYDADGNITARLLPKDQRYILPFAPIIISNNPNIVQNPR